MKTNGFLVDEAPNPSGETIILAHGAGAPMDSPYMTRVSTSLADRGIRVVRFEFPYMRARREAAVRKPPDREPVLRECWRTVIARHGGGAGVVIGGKSLGGRIASLVADEQEVRGLVCLGYPFHPPRQPQKTRTKHLASLRTPTLIVQGSRDPFGTPTDVAGYDLSPSVRIHWIEDGDHSHEPRKSSGRTGEQNLAELTDAVFRFVRSLDANGASSR